MLALLSLFLWKKVQYSTTFIIFFNKILTDKRKQIKTFKHFDWKFVHNFSVHKIEKKDEKKQNENNKVFRWKRKTFKSEEETIK